MVESQREILKAATEKGLITYKAPVRLAANFSAETMEIRRQGIMYSKC